MNRTQAIAKLRPILGKRLAYRENPKALTGENREAAQEIKRAAADVEAAAKEALNARHKEVLTADAEYQRLRTAYMEAHRASEKANGDAYHRRITVGTNEGIGFFIKAEGDNWQEVVDKLTKNPNSTSCL